MNTLLTCTTGKSIFFPGNFMPNPGTQKASKGNLAAKKIVIIEETLVEKFSH
jgi:hypothetical protein